MSLTEFGDYYPAGTKVIYDNGTSDILTSKLYLKSGNYNLGKKIKSVDITGISDPIEITRLNANLEKYRSSAKETERWRRETAEADVLARRRETAEAERWQRQTAEAEERRRAYEADAPARKLRQQTQITDDITRRNINPVETQTPNPSSYGAYSAGGSKSRRGQKRKKSRKGRSRKRRSRKTSRRRGRR